MEALVANLREAYRPGIDKLEWMGPGHEEAGARKARRSSRRRSAIPRSGATIRSSRVKKDDLVGNMMRAFEHENNYQLWARPASRSTPSSGA
jgi:predicted metalloendopeptidase